MSPLGTVNAGDLYIGSGKVTIDRLDAIRARTGERFVGNATAFSIGITDDVKEKYSSADAQRGLMKAVVTKRTPEIKLELDEQSNENLALFFMGTTASYVQTGATITNYVPPSARVRKGYSFPVEGPIGTPRRSISAVNVSGPSSTPVYVAGTDYTVNAASGTIYVIPGGSIADAAALEVDFTYATIATSALEYVKGGASKFVEVYLKFEGDPTAGPVYTYEFWIVSLSPDGEMNLIGDDFASLKLKGKVLADTVNHPGDEQFFRAYRVAAA
jgi:hypothetical protein